MLSLLCGPTLTSIHDYWKNHSFDYMDLCQQMEMQVQSLGQEDPLKEEMAEPLGRGSALSRLGAELELRRSGSSLGPSQ